MPSEREKTYKPGNYEAMIWTQKVMVRNRRERQSVQSKYDIFFNEKDGCLNCRLPDWSDAQDPPPSLNLISFYFPQIQTLQIICLWEKEATFFGKTCNALSFFKTLLFVLFSSFLKSSDLLRFVQRYFIYSFFLILNDIYWWALLHYKIITRTLIPALKLKRTSFFLIIMASF